MKRHAISTLLHNSIYEKMSKKKNIHSIQMSRAVLREKRPNNEFFLVRTEYGDLRSNSPYSARIQENTDQK